MYAINLNQAKIKFDELIDDAIGGEEILILKAGRPVVKLIGLLAIKQRHFGVLRGKIKIANDFDAPLDNDEIAIFEGE